MNSIIFHARLTKVTRFADGVVLNGTASDDMPDLYRTRMTLRLYQSFIRGYQEGQQCLLDVSHYTHGIVGNVTKLYVDGRYLKFSSELDRSPMAQMIARRLEDKSFRDSLGFSIAFHELDSYEDETAGGILTYTDGILERIAITSIPANPRARLISVEMRARTQIMDAEAIVGPLFARHLDQLERSRGIETKRFNPNHDGKGLFASSGGSSAPFASTGEVGSGQQLIHAFNKSTGRDTTT